MPAVSRDPHSREITGIVVDDTGEPLAGATITSVGEDGNRATTMMVTDVNGHFMMSLGEDTHALEVSYIGFKARRVTLTRESSYKIVLQPDSKSVGEVVVNGAFTRKANTFTGAVTTVSGDDLSRVGNQNVLQSLKNIDPSFMQIENLGAGSNPNALPDFQMRGASTISSVQGEYASSANQPLFILDGFETELTKILDLDMEGTKRHHAQRRHRQSYLRLESRQWRHRHRDEEARHRPSARDLHRQREHGSARPEQL